jgi:hypothetical protein
MRAKGGNATLGEIVGGVREMSLEKLPDILGEKMIDMPKNKVGRYRLIRSLRNRFGDNFRNIPGVKDIVKEFDEEIKYEGLKKRLGSIKAPKKGSK